MAARSFSSWILATLLFLSVASLSAAPTTTRRVDVEIQPIALFAVSGDPPLLAAEPGTAGDPLLPAVDSSTRYAITVNQAGHKIIASLNQSMPPHTSLSLALQPPSGSGAGLGEKTLGPAGVEVAVNIGPAAQSDRTLTYRFYAAPEAGAQDFSRTVTLTLTDS